MTAITLDLPQALSQQMLERDVAEDDVKAVALAAIELWLAQPEEANRSKSRFSKSAIPFTRHLIAHNRELFDELARR